MAASEAHDSGLCAADAATKARFARDLRNLTLASPRVNRHEKSGHDAAEWAPARNRCWFAARVVDVRRAYGLTIDRREAAALDRILAACETTALEPLTCAAPSGSSGGAGGVAADDALARYDDNRNGAITCAEARRHGIAPVPRSHPAYRYMRDGRRGWRRVRVIAPAGLRFVQESFRSLLPTGCAGVLFWQRARAARGRFGLSLRSVHDGAGLL